MGKNNSLTPSAEVINATLDKVIEPASVENISNVHASFSLLQTRESSTSMSDNSVMNTEEKNYYIYFIKGAKDDDNLIETIKTTVKNDFNVLTTEASIIDRRTWVTNDIINTIQQKDTVTFIYINQAYLESRVGMIDLIEILSDHLFHYLLDFQVHFLFDEKLIKRNSPNNILQTEGRVTFYEYWVSKYKQYKKIFKDNLKDDISISTFFDREKEEIERIMSKVFNVMVALAEINSKKWEQSNKYHRIEYFQPFIKAIRNLPVENLNRIFSVNEDGDSNLADNTLYLCVSAYKEYLVENARMLQYFAAFNYNVLKTDHQNKVIRIFTIEGKTVRKKGWHSLLSEEQNKLLYQYLEINRIQGVETYLLLFDSDKSAAPINFMFTQDFAIQLQSYDAHSNLTLKDIANNKIDLFPDYVKNRKHEKKDFVFLAYPSDASNNKQMIRVTGQYNITRFYEDFRERAKILFPQSELRARIIPYNTSISYPEIKNYLNLNSLGNKDIQKLDSGIKAALEHFIDETKNN